MAETVENLEANIRVNSRQGEITMRRVDKELDRMARDRRGRIKIAVDDSEAKRAQKSMSALNSALLKFPAYAAAGASALGPLTAGISALGAGAVGLTTSLVSLGGFMAGMPALLGGGIAAMGTFKLATLGVADAAKEYAQALMDGSEEGKEKLKQVEEMMAERLSPAARNLTKDLAEAQIGLQEMGREMNSGLLTGLQVGLSDTMGLLDQLLPQLRNIGDQMGVEIQQITSWLSSANMRGEMKVLLGDTTGYMRRLSDIIQSLGTGLTHVMSAARPFIQFMVDGTAKAAVSFERWAAMGRLTGNLAERFDQAQVAGQQWLGVLKNLSGGLINTMDAARPFTDWFMQSFVNMTGRWKEWTGSMEGQNSMKTFFEEAKPVLSETAGLIGDLWRVLSRRQDPEGFVSFARMLRNDVVPAIERLMVTVDENDVFDNLVRGVADAIDVFGRLAGGGLISSSIDLLADVLGTVNDLTQRFPFLTDAMTGAFAAFSLLRIAGVGGPVLGGLTALSGVVMALTGDVDLLVPAIAGLAGAFAGLKLAGLISQFQTFGGVMRDLRGAGSIIERIGMASEIGFGRTATGAGKAAGGAKGLAGALAGAGGLTALSAGLGVALAGAAVGFTVWQQENAKAKAATDDFRAAIEAIQMPEQAREVITGEVWKNVEAKKMADDFAELGWNAEEVTNKLISTNMALVESGGRLVLQQKANRNGLEGTTDVLDEMTPKMRGYFDELNAVGGTTKTNIDAIGLLGGTAADATMAFIEQEIAMKRLTREQAESILKQNEMKDGGVDLIGVTRDLSAATGQNAEEQIQLNQVWAEGEAQLRNMKSFLQEYITGRRSMSEAEEDGIEVHQRAIAAIKENGNEWQATTQKGRDNRDMLRSLYDSYLAQADAAIKSGKTVDEASKFYDNFTLTLMGLEKQGLLSKEQTADLLDTLGLTAKDWEASMTLTTLEQGELKLMYIKSALEGMDDKGMYNTALRALIEGQPDVVDRVYRQATLMNGKTYKVTFHTLTIEEREQRTRIYETFNRTGIGGPATWGRQPANGFVQMATGGVRWAKPLPSDAIIQPARPGLINWAEPETGGESFIPLAPSKRKRSIRIWMKTGELLGMEPGFQIPRMAAGGVRGSFTGFTPWQWGPGYYNAQRNKMLDLRAPSNYHESASARLFVHGIMTQMAKLGARIKQTGFGEWDFDVTGVKGSNLHQIGRILDGLSSGGFSMSKPYDSGLSGAAERQVPYVVINEATFKDEADLKSLESTLEWSVRTERI